MIYITGDTHGETFKLNRKNFKGTNKDIIIICGDFGFIWTGSKKDNYWLNWLAKKPFTTLFVDGNHENFPALYNYPEEIWNGGHVHKIRDNIFHLKRGEVFNIENSIIFTMGGGVSTDKECRKNGISWWKEEEPNYAEIENGFKNLEKVDWKVDFVITHEMPQSIIETIHPEWTEDSAVRQMLDFFNNEVRFNIWYSGHYHNNLLIKDRYQILYDNIIELGKTVRS